MITFNSLAQVQATLGQTIAVSDWVHVSQDRIQQFADATDDQQWIHTDPIRASKGPFGMPVAHGFLTLSLLPLFFDTAMVIDGTKLGVNYGLNKVRFPAPVPVNSRLRAHFKLDAFETLPPVDGAETGAQMTWEVTVEREGSDRPVCVAHILVRRYV